MARARKGSNLKDGGQEQAMERAFLRWSGKSASDSFRKRVDEHTSRKLIAAQMLHDKMRKLRHLFVLSTKNDTFYEVSKEQALGICFIRWYKITSKLYQLEQASQDEQLSQASQRLFFSSQKIDLNYDVLRKYYILQRMASSLQVKQDFQRKSLALRCVRTSHTPKDKKILSKQAKIVENLTHFHD